MIKPSGTVVFTQRSNPPTQLQNFILQLSKSDKPSKLLEALYQKYQEDGPAPKPAPKQNQQQNQNPDFKKELINLAEKKIDDLRYKIDNDDQFGKDFKKFNSSRKRILDYVMDNALHKKLVSKSKLQEQYDENILPN